MSKNKLKKDDYERALSAYGEAMHQFRHHHLDKAEKLFRAFIENFSVEKELVDRARIYLSIIEEKKTDRKETIPLKTFDDYCFAGVYKINSGAYDEALKILERALERFPGEGKFYYLKAIVHSRKNEPDACLENLKKAIQLDKFYRTIAQNEADFQPLWEDKKFKLITRIT